MLNEVDQWLSRHWPGSCVLCGLPPREGRCCGGCIADLPWIPAPCERCGAPLPSGSLAGLCARCDLVLGGLDRVRAALVYEYPVDALIAAAKFQGRMDCARALGELLAHGLCHTRATGTNFDLVIPVPLHPARLGQRGYNQALEIALPVARRLGCSLGKSICRRVRNTRAQSGLPGRERHANLRDAFEVLRVVAGNKVLLIDDVVTTGQTLSSLARSLRRAGARKVEAWCSARVCR